jgi:flagellar motor component MotA
MRIDMVDEIKMTEQLEALIVSALNEIQTPSKLKKAMIVAGAIIGTAASFVYYGPTEEMIKEKEYSTVFSYILVTSALGINALLNSYFNALAIKIMFNLRNPLTKKLKVSKKVLFATGIASAFSAFVPAFLAPPKQTIFSYVNFFGQLVCHTMQSYVGIMTTFLLINKFTHQDNHLKLAQSIDILLDQYSLDGERFETSTEATIFPQKTAQLIMETSMLEMPSESKTWLKKSVYGVAQGVGSVAQVVSLIGFLNNTVNGFHLEMGDYIAWAMGIAAILPVTLVSLQVSWDSIKKLFTINPFKPFATMPYEMKKTPWFSSICLLISTPLAALSFYTTLDLLLDAIYGNSESNPSQFAWMDKDEKLKLYYMILGCFGTDFFNAFPLPEVQNTLSRWFYLLKANPEEAQEYHKKSNFIEVLETVKENVEEIQPEPAISESNGFLAHGINTEVPKPRVSFCNKLLSWFCCSTKTSEVTEDYSIYRALV